MLFEGLRLRKITVSELMNREVLKINPNTNIEKLIEIVTNSNSEVMLVIEKDADKEILIGMVNPLDILKIKELNITLKEYINKNSKQVRFVVQGSDSVEKAVEIIITNNVNNIPVLEDSKIIGIISSHKLLAQYNSNFCKSCDIIDTVLDNIADGIAVIDKDYIVRFWNKGSEELYNIPKEEIVGRSILGHFPSALLPKVIREKKPYENVYNSPRKNTHVILSAKPLYNCNKLIGAISCDRDITELIKLSKNLNKTQHNLEILEQEVSTLNESRFTFDKIVGENPEFKETVNLCRSVSKSNINILVTGESGTGKEVFSRAIHIESGKKGHFIPINCSAIPADLMESELFGYEGGAFTGALRKGKVGKFELAHNGTLFLDEIGDMPSHMQPKILRVLEDGVINRVGSEKSVNVDVRIIAATNKDLKKMVDEGTFRKDLYYRLNSILINLPPLRERKDDIPLLVNKYFRDYCIAYRTNMPTIPQNIMDILINYHWEGNIRELKNIVERIVILVKNNGAKKVEIDFLPITIIEKSRIKTSIQDDLDLTTITENAEKRAIEKAMKLCNMNKAHAAKILNIPRSTLYFKLDKYKMFE